MRDGIRTEDEDEVEQGGPTRSEGPLSRGRLEDDLTRTDCSLARQQQLRSSQRSHEDRKDQRLSGGDSHNPGGEVAVVVTYILHELLADGPDVLAECGAEHHDLLLVRRRTEDLLHVASHVWKRKREFSVIVRTKR